MTRNLLIAIAFALIALTARPAAAQTLSQEQVEAQAVQLYQTLVAMQSRYQMLAGQYQMAVAHGDADRAAAISEAGAQLSAEMTETYGTLQALYSYAQTSLGAEAVPASPGYDLQGSGAIDLSPSSQNLAVAQMASHAAGLASAVAAGDQSAMAEAQSYGKAAAGALQADIARTQVSTEVYRSDLARGYLDTASGLEHDAWEAHNQGDDDRARELREEAQSYRQTARDYRQANER